MKKWFNELKIVKTRKEHKCEVCYENIEKGELALVQNGFNKDEGFFNNYFHRRFDADKFSCHEDYIDCMFPENDVVEKIRDQGFKGQIGYNKGRYRE